MLARTEVALVLHSTNIITISKTASLTFSNNTAGRYGGAIYATDSPWIKPVSFYDWSPCTIYGGDRINFTMNKAGVAGDNVYNGKFFYCGIGDNSIIPSRAMTMQCEVPGHWLDSNARSMEPFSMISSDPLGVCLCEGGRPNCSIASVSRRVYSDQAFDLDVAVVGYCGGSNIGNVVTINTPNIILTSGANNSFVPTKHCKKLTYTPALNKLTSSSDAVTANITLTVPGASLKYPVYVNLTILPCPAGLRLDDASKSCICNDAIAHNTPNTKCNVSWMPYPIQHSDNNYIQHYEPLDCTIAHSNCPLDYCVMSTVKFSMNESDRQCTMNRSGILCGGCKEGLSLMLGSNKCSKCSNDWLAFILLFGVCGILLVVLLMVLNLTVSVGSINGLLFYANIVKLNEPIFFSRGSMYIPVINQFVAWLNLDWGIEMCFFDGLDGYWKVMLQFVFPLYLWFLVIVMVIASRYSLRLSYLFGRNAVNVLATLILMSYTKLLRTITKALTFDIVQCGEEEWYVWNVDGNIMYLGYKHAILAVISLLFLIIGLIYTALVFASQWLQRYSSYCFKSTRDPVVKLKPFIDAYTGPYKDRYRFWTGLILLVRLVLTVLLIFTTGFQLQTTASFPSPYYW